MFPMDPEKKSGALRWDTENTDKKDAMLNCNFAITDTVHLRINVKNKNNKFFSFRLQPILQAYCAPLQ